MLKSSENMENRISGNELIFFLNGKKITEKQPDPESTLLFYLRNRLHLYGTKLGCGEGGCGACTVMISNYIRSIDKIFHFSANACLTPVCSLHGLSVTTVEGLGSVRTHLHPVQERIAKAHGSQCGFCTPGIVMSMYTLLRNYSRPTIAQLFTAFQGNLCRCTGYRPIIEGYKTFTLEYEENSCGKNYNCCKADNHLKNGEICINNNLFEKKGFQPYDPSQDPIFPPELKLFDHFDNESLIFKGIDTVWHRPLSLHKVLCLRMNYPNSKIVVGNTEVGIEMKFKHCKYTEFIYPSHVEEMNQITMTNSGIKFGASCTLDKIESVLIEEIERKPELETRIYKAIVKMLHYFAGKQIRNVSSIGGNIMTSSPISDLNPILMAASVELEVASIRTGFRKVLMGPGFFTGYRQNVIRPDEVLVSILIPKTNNNEYFEAFKQAKRREDDIAIVNGAFYVYFEKSNFLIKSINISYGGIAPTTVLALKTSEYMKGKIWNRKLIENAAEILLEEFPLSPSAPGGMVAYRRTLTSSILFKSYLSISHKITILQGNNVSELFKEDEISGIKSFHISHPTSSQFFEKFSGCQTDFDPIGSPMIHLSALKQATGEATYCDDIPKMENELYLGLVLSTKAHANIVCVDPTDALHIRGVHAFFSAQDLTDTENKVGPVFHDEEVFASVRVYAHGQTIGAIAAETQLIAQRASRNVKVVYQEIFPNIITIEDAIAHNSFFPGYPIQIIKGNVDLAFQTSDYIIENNCRIGGQEHFYLETQASLAIPRDSDELEIFSSSQHPSEIQKLVSHVLSVPSCKIVSRVKRLGGGFGGKESRASLVALPCAIAAFKLRRPVRCMLDRNEDMLMTGTRHPFFFKYKVACLKDGKITACVIECYNNAGYSMDLSFSVLERAMFHFENSYYIPNVKVIGYVCKTNLPSNTAFRGFGGPQGMFVGEHIIRDVAKTVRQDYINVAFLNMYKTGDVTHYNQKLENCNIRRCWQECLKQSNFKTEREKIIEFNKYNRWKKRGIAIVPTKFGIAFTALHLNQAGALVHIYQDGSVLISHGGVEMGQGLHTKIIQIASKIFNIPTKYIHISESSTDKIPNTSATAASVGSDINGMAVLDACRKLNERLLFVKSKFPDSDWNSWISYAYLNRISLSATGFYKTPNIGYSFETNSGNPFSYFTYGAGCSIVEIDCLTGDHHVIKTDIVMDIGSSLNPAIDIGQIEGAFMQGYGLFTLEEMTYSSKGSVLSLGPGMYKLPGFGDIPHKFNVSLLTGAANPRAIFSSKAVGEPPLFLASSVFFAIKDAIEAARKSQNINYSFNLTSPATSNKIRMACADKITQKVERELAKEKDSTPWNVVP